MSVRNKSHQVDLGAFFPSRRSLSIAWGVWIFLIAAAFLNLSQTPKHLMPTASAAFATIFLLVYSISISGRRFTVKSGGTATYETLFYSLKVDLNEMVILESLDDDVLVLVNRPQARTHIEYYPKAGWLGKITVFMRKRLLGEQIHFYRLVWGISVDRIVNSIRQSQQVNADDL